MANKSGDISNQSRNMRLLRLRKIFMEETDAEHGITMPEILRHLRAYSIEADRRTIYEDIRVLQESEKMDIEHEPGDHLYRLRSREFSVAELKLIVDSMASSKVLTPELTEELTGKLAKLCSKHERDYLKKKIFLDGRVKAQNKKIPSYIKILNEGIIRQRWVAFRYYKYDINKKKVYYYGGKHRRVRPAALLVNNDGYYLLGYDKRDRRKLYRIDRMSHVSMHTERYQELPEKLDAKMTQLSFSAGNPFLRQEDITWVKLRFRRHDVDKVLDRFGFNIHMIPDGDWCFTTTVAVEPTSEFYGWLLATGGEVLEPSLVQTSMSLKLMMANSVYTRMRRERKQNPPAHKV